MQISYIKAFSIGSCRNICGKMSKDCSCTENCVNEGTCCADYYECENLEKINLNIKHECYEKNTNCELCENLNKKNNPQEYSKKIPLKCAQCRKGFFLKKGECREKCDVFDKILLPNKICFDKLNCEVDNCSECSEKNGNICRICENGHYLHNNQCLNECPHSLRADRISWSCLEPPIFAWYWISPSKSSCKLRCGRNVDYEMDCSCNKDCFRKGDCCQDVEDYCPKNSEWK